MKWNKCFVVQFGNIQYTNIVVKMENSFNFCLLKVAIVGGRLRLRTPSKLLGGGTRSPRLPYNRRPVSSRFLTFCVCLRRRLEDFVLNSLCTKQTGAVQQWLNWRGSRGISAPAPLILDPTHFAVCSRFFVQYSLH